MEGKNLPETSFRAGSIKATVWENPGKDETTYKTVSIERGYKDKNGEWKNTTSLRVNDLPKVQVVLQKAYEHIVLTQNIKGDAQ